MKRYLSTYRDLKGSWRYQVREYFDNSTLHGVPYIAEKGRPFREKFLWFCFTLAGAITTMIIISSLWEKFQTNPTITGLDTDFHSWTIKFPTITICDSSPANPDSINAILETLGLNETSENYEYMYSFYNTIARLSYERIEDILNFTNDQNLPQENLQNVAFDVVLHCEEILFDCTLRGEEKKCCDWPNGFFPIFTENGFCYTFNSKHALRTWPWQKGGSFAEEHFYVQLVHETDEKWSIKFYNQHFTNSPQYIYIHTEEDIPGVDMLPHLVWHGAVYKIMFSVKQTYTTEDASQLSIKQRRCVFEDEIHLETNDIFTYFSCTRQCRIEAARKLCGCIPHFYKRFGGLKYCTLKQLGCIAAHKSQIMSPAKCICELGCSNTVYEVDKLLEVDLSAPILNRNETYMDMEIEFVSLPMVRYKREVIFGWVDLVVSFGGIAGLFLGFSLLSGVEILYYFTIRACCMVYRNKDDLRKFEKENQRTQIPNYDLSLTPYFIKAPEAGSGFHILRESNGFYASNVNRVHPSIMFRQTKNRKMAWEDHAPFGIQFLH